MSIVLYCQLLVLLRACADLSGHSLVTRPAIASRLKAIPMFDQINAPAAAKPRRPVRHPGCKPYAEGIANGEPTQVPTRRRSHHSRAGRSAGCGTPPLDANTAKKKPRWSAYIRRAECIVLHQMYSGTAGGRDPWRGPSRMPYGDH